jgi:hypothetical protein
MVDLTQATGLIPSSIDVPFGDKRALCNIAASSVPFFSKLIDRAVFPFPVFIGLPGTFMLECQIVNPIRLALTL